MNEGLWAMAAGGGLLLYGLCRWATATGRCRRRCKLCGLWGGSLFVLGMLFVCAPQPWGSVVLWLWGGLTFGTLLLHELVSPR
ncbi:MAG: hypothetical protein IJ518_01230 [Clostridia bacterium]|nr:hypothetical protein [Clostridia bacterium]